MKLILLVEWNFVNSFHVNYIHAQKLQICKQDDIHLIFLLWFTRHIYIDIQRYTMATFSVCIFFW